MLHTTGAIEPLIRSASLMCGSRSILFARISSGVVAKELHSVYVMCFSSLVIYSPNRNCENHNLTYPQEVYAALCGLQECDRTTRCVGERRMIKIVNDPRCYSSGSQVELEMAEPLQKLTLAASTTNIITLQPLQNSKK